MAHASQASGELLLSSGAGAVVRLPLCDTGASCAGNKSLEVVTGFVETVCSPAADGDGVATPLLITALVGEVTSTVGVGRAGEDVLALTVEEVEACLEDPEAIVL